MLDVGLNIECPSVDMSQTLQQMIAATSVSSVWSLFKNTMRHYGFESMIYASGRASHQCYFGDLREATLLETGPRAFGETFLKERLYLHFPPVMWAAQNTGFLTWDAATAKINANATCQTRRAQALNETFGFRHGIVGGMNDFVTGTNAIVGLVQRTDLDGRDLETMWGHNRQDIEALCHLLHLKVSSLPCERPQYHMTDRQREVLTWAADGKQTQDIALIMNLHFATVEKHLRHARFALDAETTAHAVRKATALHLI